MDAVGSESPGGPWCQGTSTGRCLQARGSVEKLCWSTFDCMMLELQSACFPIQQSLVLRNGLTSASCESQAGNWVRVFINFFLVLTQLSLHVRKLAENPA